jgi:hypothetical protein
LLRKLKAYLLRQTGRFDLNQALMRYALPPLPPP